MARSVRIEYPGATYHVMCRGDRKEPIFESDDDRDVFLETLEEVCERLYPFKSGPRRFAAEAFGTGVFRVEQFSGVYCVGPVAGSLVNGIG